MDTFPLELWHIILGNITKIADIYSVTITCKLFGDILAESLRIIDDSEFSNLMMASSDIMKYQKITICKLPRCCFVNRAYDNLLSLPTLEIGVFGDLTEFGNKWIPSCQSRSVNNLLTLSHTINIYSSVKQDVKFKTLRFNKGMIKYSSPYIVSYEFNKIVKSLTEKCPIIVDISSNVNISNIIRTLAMDVSPNKFGLYLDEISLNFNFFDMITYYNNIVYIGLDSAPAIIGWDIIRQHLESMTKICDTQIMLDICIYPQYLHLVLSRFPKVTLLKIISDEHSIQIPGIDIIYI